MCRDRKTVEAEASHEIVTWLQSSPKIYSSMKSNRQGFLLTSLRSKIQERFMQPCSSTCNMIKDDCTQTNTCK